MFSAFRESFELSPRHIDLTMGWLDYLRKPFIDDKRLTEFFQPGAIIYTSDKSSLPQNAVRLSPDQLTLMEFEVAKNWQNRREM